MSHLKCFEAVQVTFDEWNIQAGIFTQDDLKRYSVYFMEKISDMAFKSGHAEWMGLIDMNHFSIFKHACMPCN